MRRLLAVSLAALVGCGGAPAEPARVAPTPPPAATPPPTAPAAAETPLASTPPLPAPEGTAPAPAAPTGPPRAITLAPVHGAGSLFALSDWADRDDGVARRYDGARASWGPPIALGGEHFVAAYDRGDAHFVLVTSTLRALCLSVFAIDAASPERKTCAPAAPEALALVGDRLALLETTTRTLGGPKKAAATGKKASTKAPKKATSEPSKSPKKKKKKKDDGHSEPPKPPSPAPRTKTRTEVDLTVRWVDEHGHFDDEATPTGLTFERAMEGLELIDATPRGDGFDVVWYEAGVPPKVTRGTPRAGALGWGRIAGGFVDAKGQFDKASRRELVRGPLEWGYVEGARIPRIAPFRTHPWLLTLAGRGAQCEATSLLAGGPALLSKTLCTTLPPLLGGTAEEAIPYLEQAAAELPEKAPGERRDGFGFVTWAGGRGFYLAQGRLRSVGLDGPPRDEPWPLFEASSPSTPTETPSQSASLRGPCPAEMVSIRGAFCIDRFESQLVDGDSGAVLSPDFPTTPNLLQFALGEGWMLKEGLGDVHGRAFPMPSLPLWQLGKTLSPRAVARKGVRPQGYATGLVAEAACAAAGKRLCSEDEFVTACRGERDTLFPYGPDFEEGACNVFREDHPASLLHDNPSLGHLDPRLNRVPGQKGPLLHVTGDFPKCVSRWGDDGVYDLVGNLDEWLDEPNGAFAGGFYARSTRNGCEALVGAHPKSYLDYSTGVRCCGDGARPAPRESRE